MERIPPTHLTIGTAFPSWNNILAIGSIPIFEFSLIVLFVIGAIYWFGFKRRHVIANGEVGFDPARLSASFFLRVEKP